MKVEELYKMIGEIVEQNLSGKFTQVFYKGGIRDINLKLTGGEQIRKILERKEEQE